jgi:hypothetical protein
MRAARRRVAAREARARVFRDHDTTITRMLCGVHHYFGGYLVLHGRVLML